MPTPPPHADADADAHCLPLLGAAVEKVAAGLDAAELSRITAAGFDSGAYGLQSSNAALLQADVLVLSYASTFVPLDPRHTRSITSRCECRSGLLQHSGLVHTCSLVTPNFPSANSSPPSERGSAA